MVRGLALRSLCGLRLESILEYVEKPLQKGLNDISAYVRKTAILGVLKVNWFPFLRCLFLSSFSCSYIT
jgi:AP-4 complex subunit beta-1